MRWFPGSLEPTLATAACPGRSLTTAHGPWQPAGPTGGTSSVNKPRW